MTINLLNKPLAVVLKFLYIACIFFITGCAQINIRNPIVGIWAAEHNRNTVYEFDHRIISYHFHQDGSYEHRFQAMYGGRGHSHARQTQIIKTSQSGRWWIDANVDYRVYITKSSVNAVKTPREFVFRPVWISETEFKENHSDSRVEWIFRRSL